MYTKTLIARAAAASLVNCRFFTVAMAKFGKHEVEKKTLHKAEMEELSVQLAEVVEEKKIKIEDGMFTRKIDAA